MVEALPSLLMLREKEISRWFLISSFFLICIIVSGTLWSLRHGVAGLDFGGLRPFRLNHPTLVIPGVEALYALRRRLLTIALSSCIRLKAKVRYSGFDVWMWRRRYR
ncbi:hypothetical protein Bca4012_095897 [Brassica carinata]|uniref:Uncharacterized protein n=2 Tax=Brassica oleracea TaxID=3712 RepID=A0A0D3DV13_BRAOL|nr:unnamed protein product [Brassica oleracea]